MNRWVGALIVVALLAVGFAGYSRPDWFGGLDMPGIVWGIMALLLVTGAGWGFQRFRSDGGMALAGILFWAALIVALTFAYSWFN
jgi:hypothetical protein